MDGFAGRALWRAFLLSAAWTIVAGTPARSQLVISTAPTSNVSCSAGSCSATEAHAVLNAKDVKKLLLHSNLTIFGGNASSIVVASTVKWSTRYTLKLNATPIYIAAPIKVADNGRLELTTLEQDGPRIAFSNKGSISFANIRHRSLVIDALPYTLVTSLADLIEKQSADPSGAFAFVRDDDASAYGTFSKSPLAHPSKIEGLGHTIKNLHVDNTSHESYVGLISQLDLSSSVRDLNLIGVSIHSDSGSCVGGIVGNNQGFIGNVTVSGTVSATQALATGGLVGCNSGTIARSFADAAVTGNIAGGLLGDQSGIVHDVMAGGAVSSQSGPNQPTAGGLIGKTETGSVQSGYSQGPATGQGDLGGAIGEPLGNTTFANVYWNTTTSGNAAGCSQACTGVTGLTSTQLRAGLPAGLDPAVWAESSSVNDGLPYLLAAMPR